MVTDDVWARVATRRNMSVPKLHETIKRLDADLADKGVESHFRDRDGDVISIACWSMLSDLPEYRYVDRTTLGNGRWVATIWVGGGLDDDVMPLFEGSTFSNGPGHRPLGEPLEQCEYLDEAAARAGHERMVVRWS